VARDLARFSRHTVGSGGRRPIEQHVDVAVRMRDTVENRVTVGSVGVPRSVVMAHGACLAPVFGSVEMAVGLGL
jgi:hypothetical protein